jgi:cytochrome c
MRLSASLTIVLTASALVAACGSSSTTKSGDAATTTVQAATPALDSPENKTLVAELGAGFEKADLANGQTRFALCRSCHTIVKDGPNMTGPNLYGLFGRKAGSVASYTYSAGMKAYGATWDAKTLDAWIKDPHAVIAQTKMSFPGLKSDEDRRDLIAYLKVASNGGAN